MFGSRSVTPRVNLSSQRLRVRLTTEKDSGLLTDYYQENRQFLSPWEPLRDESYYQYQGWERRLQWMAMQQRQRDAYYFLLLDPHEQQLLGVANFTQIIGGCFHACYLGYSLAQRAQGQGLMQEALQLAIPYMQQQQQIHRIMANYMPRNLRSGQLLSRLGFEKEGYARDYLKINDRWEDHVLTALITD